MQLQSLTTIKDLRASGYQETTVKDEIRNNLIKKIKNNQEIFPGILGYEDSVIPELQNAILSKHDFILLGLRGQAKSKILRGLSKLMDDYIPVIKDCEINDHPYHPICKDCRDKINSDGDNTEIEWISPPQRYSEKL